MRNKLFILATLFALLLISAESLQEKDQIIKVHFVPHSHLDAGWLLTYDNYYDNSVSKIFHEVIQKLNSDAEDNYTYSVGDIAFFRRFYEDQPKD